MLYIRKKTSIIFLLVTCLYNLNLLGQKLGSVNVFCQPRSSIIRIDTMKIISSSEPLMDKIYRLPEKKYSIKAWAPGFNLFQDSIEILSDVLINSKKIILSKSESYKAFELMEKKYERKRKAIIGLPIITTLVFGVVTFNKNKKTNALYDSTLLAKKNYDKSISIEDITNYRDKFLLFKDDYKASRSTLNKMLVAIPILIVSDCILIYFANRIKKPIFTEIPLLSRINVNINSNVINYTSVNINYAF